MPPVRLYFSAYFILLQLRLVLLDLFSHSLNVIDCADCGLHHINFPSMTGIPAFAGNAMIDATKEASNAFLAAKTKRLFIVLSS